MTPALGRGLARTLCFAVWLGVAAPAPAQTPLPAPVSPAPRPSGPGGLKAGFGRADITPAPGVGLAGNGPEGRRSTGWRFHLYARALELADPAGERIAFLGAALVPVYPNIHPGT